MQVQGPFHVWKISLVGLAVSTCYLWELVELSCSSCFVYRLETYTWVLDATGKELKEKKRIKYLEILDCGQVLLVFGFLCIFPVCLGPSYVFYIFLWLPIKSVWWTKVSLRATFFVWSVALGKILAITNMRKQHVIVIDRWSMCIKNGEFVDDLLLHCEVAGAFFSRFGLSWVKSRWVVDLSACWWKACSAESTAV
jgi:hypothetical protein